jgi:transcriptional regulator with XRE-family HTH domain
MTDQPNAGKRTQTLRQAHGLSVAELADRAGCQAEMIDELERGNLAPSLAPLSRIARALGVRVGTLLDDVDVPGPVVTRQGEYRLVTRYAGTGVGCMEYYGLAAGKATRHMDPFVIVVPPGDRHPASTHEGEEFLFVMEGEIELEYGKERYTLRSGESIYYDSIVSHRVTALGPQPARVLSVVYTPA